MTSNQRRSALAAGVALAVSIAAVVVGLLLATHVRYTCGSDIERLTELYCTHETHPYRTLGLIIALVGAAIAVNVTVWLATRNRRMPRGGY